jgi:hypothetical protein
LVTANTMPLRPSWLSLSARPWLGDGLNDKQSVEEASAGQMVGTCLDCRRALSRFW